jgi:hypothetical protein
MRKDEEGNPCPGTLGEYRDLCAALAPDSRAVEFLDERIARDGRDDEIIAEDSQMRLLLFPMLTQPRQAAKEDA